MVGSPLMNMNTSLMPAQGINPQALALLQAALKQGQPGPLVTESSAHRLAYRR